MTSLHLAYQQQHGIYSIQGFSSCGWAAVKTFHTSIYLTSVQLQIKSTKKLLILVQILQSFIGSSLVFDNLNIKS